MQLAGMRIGFGLTGSYCTIPDVLPEMKRLRAEGAELFPIVSPDCPPDRHPVWERRGAL